MIDDEDGRAEVQQRIEEALPAVHRLAMTSKRPSWISLEDLRQEAALGLVESAHRFDPGREALLQTYAAPRARGRIIEAIRKGTLFGNRSIRGLLEVADGVEDAGAEDPFSDPEETKATIGAFIEASIFAMWLADSFGPVRGGDGHASTAYDARAALDLVRRELDPDDQTLLEMRYWRDLSWKEIGAETGATEDAVKCRHKRILAKLRDKLLGGSTHERL